MDLFEMPARLMDFRADREIRAHLLSMTFPLTVVQKRGGL